MNEDIKLPCETNDKLNIVVDKILKDILQDKVIFSNESHVQYYARKCLINQRNTLLNLASSISYYSKRAQSTHKLLVKQKFASINILKDKKSRESVRVLYKTFKDSIKTDYSDIVSAYIQTSRQFISDLDLLSNMATSKLLLNIKGFLTPFITAKELNIATIPQSAMIVFLRLNSARKKLLSLSRKAELCHRKSFKLQIPFYSLPPYEGMQRIELDNRLASHDKEISTLIFAPNYKTLLNSQI